MKPLLYLLIPVILILSLVYYEYHLISNCSSKGGVLVKGFHKPVCINKNSLIKD